jgi:hypothetical protein
MIMKLECCIKMSTIQIFPARERERHRRRIGIRQLRLSLHSRAAVTYGFEGPEPEFFNF